MRQASYGTYSYHSDATTMSETDAERGRYEEVTVTDLIKIWVLPGGLEGPRVKSTVVDS